MYRVDIIAVGRIRERYLTEGIQEYRKRLSPFARVGIIEVRDEGGPSLKVPPSRVREVLRLEGESIRGRIAPGSHVIALDRKGKTFSSREFSRYLAEQAGRGRSRLTFLIGGSLGLDPSLLREADLTLSFSSLTFPHQLFRLLLLEQLYRAFSIMQGHPYHK